MSAAMEMSVASASEDVSGTGNAASPLRGVYRPLDEGEIRLIHLYPQGADEAINFQLRTYHLEASNLPFFEAVSYTWGERKIRHEAICNQFWPMGLHDNVAKILMKLRRLSTPRTLWIDMLCINQEDWGEKSQQVPLMGVVYQKADRVLICLVDQQDGAQGKFHDAMEAVRQRRVESEVSIMSVFELLKRPWFSRVWILQEVALARVALVICGEKCVPWSCFTAWWAKNAGLLEEIGDIPPVIAIGPATKRASLLQQLHGTRHSRSTDARDKVYALTGLLTPEDRLGIFVDYTTAPEAVFGQVAISIIRKTQSLLLLSGREPLHKRKLSYGQDFTPGQHKRSKSSWIPYWNVTPGVMSLGLSSGYQEPYNAGGSPACGLDINDTETQSPSLCCLGITFDTIAHLSEICPSDAPSEVLHEALNQWHAWLDAVLQGIDTKTIILYHRPTGLSYSQWLLLPRDLAMRNPWGKDYCAEDWERLLGGIAPAQSHLEIFDALRMSGGITCSHGRFKPQNLVSEELWETLLAQPPNTFDVSSEEAGFQRHRPVTREGLKFCLGRRLMVTSKGNLGLVPDESRLGDTIAILTGAPVPHVLRRVVNDDCYYLVGECYVHGVMGGEALEHLRDELRGYGHKCPPSSTTASSASLQSFTLL